MTFLLDWLGIGGFCCLLLGGWFALSFIPDLSFLVPLSNSSMTVTIVMTRAALFRNERHNSLMKNVISEELLFASSDNSIKRLANTQTEMQRMVP